MSKPAANIAIQKDVDGHLARIYVDDAVRFTAWSYPEQDDKGAYHRISAYYWDRDGAEGGGSYSNCDALAGVIESDYSEQAFREFIAARVPSEF